MYCWPPPLIQYAIAKNPDWPIHALPFTDKSPDFPILTSIGYVVFGLNPKAKNLVKAMNTEIQKIWATCKNKEFGANYGLTQDIWYTPGEENLRTGVDRPEDWKLPSCGS